MKFPIVTRRRLNQVVSESIAMLKRKEEANAALAKERDHWKAQAEGLMAATVKLGEDNAAAAKILGVLTQRGAVRVALTDLQCPPPRITVKQENNTRKPTLQVLAHYPEGPASREPTIPADEQVVVGRTIARPKS